MASESPRAPAAPAPGDGERVPVWPHLLFRELLAALLCGVLLAATAILFDAPLEDPADPAHTPNPAKAPWYFVGLQELLGYFDPWIAGVVIPALIVFGLCAIPYLDPTRAGQGVYTVRERPLAATIFIVGVVGWFVLIAVGLWFRGPGWAWVWPGSSGPVAESAGGGWSLPNPVGVPLVIAYFLGGGAWIVRRTRAWPGFTVGRRWTFALLLLAMAGVPIKIALQALLGLRFLVRFDAVGFSL